MGAAGVSPTNVVRINGITLDSGATIQAAPTRSGGIGYVLVTLLPRGQGRWITTQPADHDKSYAWYLATATNCEIGIIGFGATGGRCLVLVPYSFHPTGIYTQQVEVEPLLPKLGGS